jgi:hypothetical protein
MSQCKVQIVYLGRSSTLCSRSCADLCRHSNMVKEQPPCGSYYWRPIGDPHCPRLASRVFSVLKPQRPRNAGGFVHSPAFWKQRPEGAMNQNTKWHEWCCIALPKRIRTKRALCELYEQDALVLPSIESNAKRANVLSAWTPLYRCDCMLSIRSI